jgi:hypothetical protein
MSRDLRRMDDLIEGVVPPVRPFVPKKFVPTDPHPFTPDEVAAILADEAYQDGHAPCQRSDPAFLKLINSARLKGYDTSRGRRILEDPDL